MQILAHLRASFVALVFHTGLVNTNTEGRQRVDLWDRICGTGSLRSFLATTVIAFESYKASNDRDEPAPACSSALSAKFSVALQVNFERYRFRVCSIQLGTIQD